MDKFSFQGQSLPLQEQPTRSIPIANCSVCNELLTEHSVTCHKCQDVCHRNCFNGENDQQHFTCSKCTSLHEQIRTPDSPKSIISHRTKSSNASTSSNVRRKILELQRLEEERQLAKERDAEFLRQKYQLLQETEEINDNNSVNRNSIRNWLNNQPTPPHLPEPTTISIPTTNNRSQMALATNNKVTFTTANSNQNQVTTQSQQNNVPIKPTTTFQNQMPPLSLNSTSFNHSATFINQNSAQPSTTRTAPQRCGFLEAPNNTTSQNPFCYSFRPSSSNFAQNGFASNLTHQQINARQTVPKDLPTFSGNPAEWPLFSSTYDWSTMVCGLTDAENLIRLQKALKGDSLRAVQHLLIHPSCVPATISTLKLLYGQPEKILHSLKLKIRSLPIVNVNKLETITNFAIQVKGLQATIEACGILDELNNPSLLQELVSKLPSYFRLNWGTHKINLAKQNKNANLPEFSEWLFDIGISASCVNIESDFTSTAEIHPHVKQKNVYVHNHTDLTKKNCIVCGGGCNNVAKCRKFFNADRTGRWNLVREFNLCKQCLRRHYGKCNNTEVCGVDNCQFKHHYLLHKQIEDAKQNAASAQPTKSNVLSDTNNNKSHSCNTHSAMSSNNLFKIIPITIYGNENKFINTFAFIDDGSSTSLIDEQIINDLKLSGIAEPLSLKWTGSVERNEDNSNRLAIKFSGPNKKVFNVEVRTVRQLSLPKQSLNTKKLVEDFKYLAGLPVQSYSDAMPRILIGLNNSRVCVYDKIREGRENEPVAIRTRLGWLIYGSTRKNTLIEHHHCHVNECSNKILSDLMKRFYSIDAVGTHGSKPVLSKEDERAMAILKSCTKQRSDGHYETSLLWRSDNINLPDSYNMALKRLMYLEKKLKSDSQLKQVFENTISEYIAKGYVTKIIEDCSTSTKIDRVWYLPIFAVFNKNKPGKTRIVWDAAAKAHGVSLNDMLLTGPDILCSLPSILIRFRQKSIAICGDIEQMFHQVFIKKEDRNVQRFLWRCKSEKEPDAYVMNVMIFGASCS